MLVPVFAVKVVLAFVLVFKVTLDSDFVFKVTLVLVLLLSPLFLVPLADSGCLRFILGILFHFLGFGC